MTAPILMPGQQFDRLTIVESLGGPSASRTRFRCRCICGCLKDILASHLYSDAIRSCGCLRNETTKRLASERRLHGHARRASPKSRTWISWAAMHQRCGDSSASNFKNYGGRGICVCPQWNEFVQFLADMGERPAGKTLDRIDVNGNYEPTNCQWATHIEQEKNKRASARQSGAHPASQQMGAIEAHLAAARSLLEG